MVVRHWLTDGGTWGFFDGFVAYGQGRWLYGEVFLEFCMGLAFCPSVFEFSTFGFILLPFWVPSFVRSLVVTSRLVSVAVCCPLFR